MALASPGQYRNLHRAVVRDEGVHQLLARVVLENDFAAANLDPTPIRGKSARSDIARPSPRAAIGPTRSVDCHT